MKENKKKKGFITLGFDPHGGKHDLMWLRIEGFRTSEKPVTTLHPYSGAEIGACKKNK